MNVRAAALQIAAVEGDPQATLEKCEQWLDRAAGEGVTLAVLPETILPGDIGAFAVADEQGGPDAVAALAEQLESVPGPSTERIAAKAREHGMTVVVGVMGRSKRGTAVNAAVVLEPDGSVAAVHCKAHLTPGFEAPYLDRGATLDVHETSVGRMGVAICADFTLPETARTFAVKGAQVMCGPLSVWYHGPAAEDDPLRLMYVGSHASPSRAIDNEAYFITCNRVGWNGGREFFGISRIIAPNGQIIAEGREGVDAEELVIADLDVGGPTGLPFSLMARRRPELYGALSATEVAV